MFCVLTCMLHTTMFLSGSTCSHSCPTPNCCGICCMRSMRWCIHILDRSTPSTPSSSSLMVITSLWNWNWNWDSVSLSSMGYYPPPPYPGAMFYPPYPGYSAYCSAPLADVTNYSPDAWSYPCPDYSTNESSSQPWNAGTTSSVEPYVIKFLNGWIKVCADCKGPHPKGPNNELLPPPNDFCIQHTEPLKFINPCTGIESRKIGNAYYHINIVCIRRKHPHFSPKLVSCPEEVINIMQPSHFKLLYDALGYVMQWVFPSRPVVDIVNCKI